MSAEHGGHGGGTPSIVPETKFHEELPEANKNAIQTSIAWLLIMFDAILGYESRKHGTGGGDHGGGHH